MASLHPSPAATNGLEAVFFAHRTALVRFLRARAGDEAEDIAQDLWARLRRAGSEPIGDPLAYLFRMADNLVIDRARASARRGQRQEAWHEINVMAESEAVHRPVAERTLIARQELSEVERRLLELGERTLVILRKYRLDGISQPAIAAELGISLSTVEKHLQRAYRLLLAIRRDQDADSAAGWRLDTKGSDDDEG